MASQSDPSAFSVRIVSIDYYMAPPIPDIDLCYSSFQGGKVEEVPVIRIYGPTLSGQKTCLHVHRALPYFYVPCSDVTFQTPQEGHAYTEALSHAIEKALMFKSSSGSKRQHVHGCSLVRAKKFYGYHSSEELFVKILLYYPHEVSRAASLLREGAVFGRSFQPHESHIPYLLQFLIDYNLYGMGHVHVSKVKFRDPQPSHYTGKFTYDSSSLQAESSGEASRGLCSLSPTVPSDPTTNGHDAFGNQTSHSVKRQSICELEGDSVLDDILNQQLKMYTSLSQSSAEVKMVQSLLPIWEEYERTGMQEASKSVDVSKPLPENVLRSFLSDIEFMNAFLELCSDRNCSTCEATHLVVKPTSESGKSLAVSQHLKATSSSGECMKEEFKSENASDDDIHTEKIKESHVPLPTGKQILSSSLKESPDPEVNDTEALGLLGWLASSQAAEDLNLDDELVHEAILSPLLTKNTFGEVLEKACLDYESASQQECQDILDSVEVDVQVKSLTAQAESNVDCRNMICSSKKVIPQVDGSCDDQFEALQMGESSETNVDTGGKKLSSDQMKKGAEPLLRNKNKRNRLLWGVLPFCPREKASDDLESASASSTEITTGQFKLDIDSASSSGSEVDKSNDSSKFDRDNCHLREEKLLNRCSTRDLMRRKRHSRVERSGDEALKIKKLAPEALRPDWKILNPDIGGQEAQNDLETSGAGRCAPGAFEQGCRLVLDDCNSIRIMELPSSSFSDLSMRSNMSLKGFVSYHEENNKRESTGAPGELPCLESTGPPLLHAALRLMPDSINSNQPGTDSYRSFCARCKVEKNSESCQCTSEFAGADTCSNDLSFIDSSKTNLDKPVEGLYQGQTLALTSLTNFTDKCTGSHQANNITNNSQAEEGLPVQFDNHREGNLRFRLNYLQTKDHSSGEHDLHVEKGRSCLEYIEMTFNRKAPTRDQIKSNCESSAMATVHNRDSVGSLSNPSEALVCNNSVFDSGGQHIDDLHPFFINNFKKEERVDAYQTKETHFTPHEIVQGVPTHFQNDGSLLYLLTPALAPPSLECVNQWLRNSEQNSLGLNKGISSDCFHEEQGKSSMKAGLCLKTNNDCLHDVQEVQQIQEQIASFEAETNLKHTDHVMGKSQTGDIQMKVKKCTENLQEVSQISGPDEKSKLTPLSQIGFRDPASVGAGQQLTMVSIEVQTESRGDFRPDPQFDAVNIIALVVQGDNDDTFEVYVLLRAKDGELSGRSIDGVSNCKFVNFLEEKQLLHHFVNIICSCDPDILMGWEIQGGSLGFLAERAAQLGIGLLKSIYRATVIESKPAVKNSASPEERADDMLLEVLEVDPVAHKDTVIEDEWGRTHASGIHVSGRIVLNIWRLIRAELKLNMYTLEAVTEAVLRLKVPSIPVKILNQWFSTGPERARFRSIDYIIKRAKLNLQIMNQLDMINRTSELARIFGIDFFSVLSRGSQYRVESMLLRLAHTQNYLCISPGSHQVSSQPAMECLPLVMEPESGFYTDPVIVLDFQSLYPSMIIGYNLCFSTCLGKVLPSKENVLGVSSYSAEPQLLRDLFQQILLTPNGVMYVPSKVRKGVLPRLLEEILSTRIMVKQAMKKLMPSEQLLHRVFNARQLALKLIANVTYGYTAAGFSGRMPCAELADSIVQCGRRTLEKAILFVNTHETWHARVIYGDTDSMFVLLKGRSMEEAFRIGHEIASSVTAMNPSPVTLKMEKVYQPCVLLTKKRYVGYSYESPDQGKPVFDAKGIETVRRDTCPAVAKALECSLRILFEERDILKVKLYLVRQWTRILSGKVSIQDFVFAKEVRLGTYGVRSSSLPPAAIVATKAMRADPRAEPLHGERVPYVVIHGEPGARLIDMVLNPLYFLEMNSPYRLNDLYYINKQIIPALQRVFGLVGADLNQWFLDMPRPIRSTLAKRHYNQSSRGSVKSRIDNYYLSKHCALCGKLVQASSYLCEECSIKEPIVATALIGRTSKLERDIHHLSAICRHCGGGDWITESGVKCTSLSCSVFYEGRKVQKELQALSTVATDKRFYPTCMAEWF